LQTALSSHPQIFCSEFRSFGNLSDVVTDFNPDGSVRGNRMRLSGLSYARVVAPHLNLDQIGIDRSIFQDDFSVSLAHFMFDYFRRLSRKPIIIDKYTVGYIEDITIRRYQERFPGFSFIFLVRDGRDVAVSLAMDWIKRRRNGEVLNVEDPVYRRYVLKEEVDCPQFFTSDKIAEMARGWARNCDALGDMCGHVMRYEDMKQDQTKSLQQFLAFIGADTGDALIDVCVSNSSFEKMSGGRKPGDVFATTKARSGISGSWKHYFTREDASIFVEVAGTELRRFGYEPDDSWAEACPATI
jgi:hypothetical protein